MLVVKRGIVLFGCAVAVAAGSSVVAAAPASACPYGTTPSRFEGVCVAGGPGNIAVSPVGPSTGQIVQNPGQVAQVQGIPCTPEHYGTCLALSQQG